MPTDHRAATRYKIEAFVKLKDESGEYVFVTRDISISGFFLYTKVAHVYPISIGNKLEIELYNYDVFVKCEVTVVRVVATDSEEAQSYPTGFAVQISGILPEEKVKLDKMIAKAEQA